MIWAVVDTNVLISGAIVARGDSAFEYEAQEPGRGKLRITSYVLGDTP